MPPAAHPARGAPPEAAAPPAECDCCAAVGTAELFQRTNEGTLLCPCCARAAARAAPPEAAPGRPDCVLHPWVLLRGGGGGDSSGCADDPDGGYAGYPLLAAAAAGSPQRRQQGEQPSLGRGPSPAAVHRLSQVRSDRSASGSPPPVARRGTETSAAVDLILSM
eukprot:TRINITY_DN31719_c0_g1_i1.p1 TRINITY_DN31719_c0_g1~~TRINITY_DN31719_c0_g1_i1.p1  ORF type:complete len:164 (+),score=7.35 TRINITY_DN31719_c0_g1_i1:65-556(+)